MYLSRGNSWTERGSYGLAVRDVTLHSFGKYLAAMPRLILKQERLLLPGLYKGYQKTTESSHSSN